MRREIGARIGDREVGHCRDLPCVAQNRTPFAELNSKINCAVARHFTQFSERVEVLSGWVLGQLIFSVYIREKLTSNLSVCPTLWRVVIAAWLRNDSPRRC